MKLGELSQHMEIAIGESLEERFMDSEELYIRFLKKLKQADFAALEAVVQNGEWQEAERRAHNLKGVCANLGLLALQRGFAELVTLLRSKQYTPQQAEALLEKIKLEWSRTLAYIAQL